jgi:hypothetical protein
MRLLEQEDCAYYIDWEIVGAEGGGSLHMLNPFDSSCRDAEALLQLLTEPMARNPRRGKATTGP